MINPISRTNNTPWDHDDDPLWLLTPDEFQLMPDGTVLTSINDERKTVGKDYIDTDTRGGFIAYGIKESEIVTCSYCKETFFEKYAWYGAAEAKITYCSIKCVDAKRAKIYQQEVMWDSLAKNAQGATRAS